MPPTPPPTTTDDVTAGLRAGADDQCDPFNAAAVALLIVHGRWLDRPELLNRCTWDRTAAGDWWGVIRWDEVGRLLAAAPSSMRDTIGSPTSWTMLAIAHTIATDALGLKRLDAANRRFVAGAIAGVFNELDREFDDAVASLLLAAQCAANADTPGASTNQPATGPAASS